MAAIKDITISQGHSYSLVMRWETEPRVRKPISGITCPNGSALIECTGHEVPDGWRVAITNVKGMSEINVADPNAISDAEYHAATVIDADHIELNEVNAAAFKPWTSGGFVQYNTPVDLTGYSARIRMKTKKGGTVLASNLVADAPNDVLLLTIDTAKSTITLTFTVAATNLLAGKSGWYDVEMVSADVTPVVTQLVSGSIKIEKE